MQTLLEYWTNNSENGRGEFVKIGNREIMEMSKDRNLCNKKGFCVLSSAGSKPEEGKAFLIFEEDGKTDREVLEFLKAAVNQCEIVHTLFILGYNGK